MKAFAVELDGTLTAIYSDDLASLIEEGQASITRVSHVEPNPDGKGWIADMAPVQGPKLGPYKLREEALSAETAWLETRLF